MEEILAEYRRLLGLIDEWFGRCMERYPDKIACGTGCSSCCRGLFDITLLDALFLKRGFDALASEVKERVLAKCNERLSLMREEWPELAHPFLLNHRPDEDWEELMPDEDETPCVLLDDEGRCLVYDHRPMTCRLHGIPFVDTSGEVMHDEWCTMNFTETDPLSLPGISAPFDAIFRQEVALFRLLAEQLVGKRVQEMDTLIPLALMIEFDNFDWPGWFADFRPYEEESEE